MKRMLTLFAGLFALCLTFSLQAQENLEFLINSPAGLEGQIEVGNPAADFGGNLLPGESVSGDLVLVEAQNSMGNDTVAQRGCDSLLNGMEIMGNVALIRRGDCFFSDKVHYAEQQGAIAAVICNANPGEGVIVMGAGGDFAGTATIPSGFISYEDCELILQEIGSGGTVNITMRVPTFFDAFYAYSYHTPLNHAIPMDAIQVTLTNASGGDASNVDVSVDITAPGGDITTYTETIETFLAGADSTISFDDYLPTELGEYGVRFYNTLNTDELNYNFVMTEDIFAPDAGVITGAPTNQASFEDVVNNAPYTYSYGTLQLTGDADNSVATHCVFGINNAADVFSDNPTYDVVRVVLYDADEDEDGELDWSGGAGESFEDLTPVAIGSYPITGNEDPEELISVALTTFAGEPYQLKPNHSYTVSIQYTGEVGIAETMPGFVSSDGVPYFAYTTPLYLGGAFFNGGWSGQIVVCRLIIDETTNTEDIQFLEEGSVSLSPNPATDYMTLDLDLVEQADQVLIDIYTMDGKVVQTRDLGAVQSGTFEFDVTNLTAGMYYMSVKTSVGYQSIPFVVTH